MKCLKCQFENPDSAKFCINCGAPMKFHCPHCGADGWVEKYEIHLQRMLD
jgi:hypothetical protein